MKRIGSLCCAPSARYGTVTKCGCLPEEAPYILHFPCSMLPPSVAFYLALMIVLWLLIMRGASIELRMQIDSGVWRSFFDGLFFFSSALLAIFFGAALANVIRGVPLADDGYFFLPLWTNWRVGDRPGILDWYTVIGGVVALVALAIHGALYVAVKTDGDLQQRARVLVRRAWIVLTRGSRS